MLNSSSVTRSPFRLLNGETRQREGRARVSFQRFDFKNAGKSRRGILAFVK
jgi:hypothetical protein